MVTKIFIVEDNPGDVDLIRLLLPETGSVTFVVESVKRLSEAVGRLARDNSFDLILLDLGLPDSSGLETFHTLHAAAPEVPIIILTGNIDQELALTAVKEGAQDFLVKGQITGALIVRAILYALERKRSEELLLRQVAITTSINRILQHSFKAKMDKEVVNICLAEAKQITGSTSGWIGEMKPSGVMATVAVTTTECDFSRCFTTEKTTSSDLGNKSILDSVLNNGQPLLINNFGQKDHGTDLLNEYPQLTALLAVPLHQNDRIVGVIVLVNKPSGYSLQDQETLQTLSLVLSETLQRKRNDAELELLRTAIEQAGETILITDIKGSIQYVNPAFTRVTGYEKAEAIGKNPRILKSGEQDPSFYTRLWNTIANGETFQCRIVNKHKSGRFFTEDATISPVYNTSGTITNYVAVKRDVTEHIRLEVDYQHAQKLEAIGTLAGGIAHDFNNILTAILGYTELASQEVGKESKAGKDLQQVYAAGKRAVDLVRQILTISRQVKIQKHPVRMQSIVKEVLKLLRPSVTTSIAIKSNCDPECPTIFADPTEMYQMIMNLCTNAYHAMRDMPGENHVMEIDLKPVTFDQTSAVMLGVNVLPGRYVNLSVSDTGCGIRPEVLTKIFDPYFTTKKEGEGTGLGLAMVNSIVIRNGGDLSVKSTPGKGTTFSIYLPVQEEKAPEYTLQSRKISEQLKGTERIMVIDDEEPIVRLLKRILLEFGYQVAAFTDCEEAVAAFNKEPMAFDLIITDMNMPKMIGTELAQIFLYTKPELPIVLCSGFSDSIDQETARSIGIKKFLFKPLDKNILLLLIRNLLDEKVVKN